MSTQAATRRAATEMVRVILGLLLLAGMLIAFPLPAKTLRFASAFDPQSMDPHGLALQYQTRVVSQIYESLVFRDRNFDLEPALALSWQPIDARTWRFKLRPGVKFHDGTPFTADDVVFSIERALAKNSQRAFQLRGVVSARKVDDLTVDFLLAAPDAVLPEKLVYVGVMSKAWCAAHGVTEPQNYNAKQETYAVRNANGTGPYRLKSYESDARTVLVANPDWWGRRGNVDEAVYVVIQSDATRLAALVSDQVDFVIDPPFQDIARLKQEGRFKLAEMPDIGTQYLGFDQSHDELQFGDVKGRNPFKDLRVRRAIYQAVDIDVIINKVLRGQATATGSYISRLVDGYAADLDRRLPYDPAAARALLKEAGYPDGFGVTLDCVNVAFRAAVCQAIDIDVIINKVLRGLATATGSYVSRLVDGYVADLDRRLPYDPAAARTLLKEAGYPDGFGVTLDCVNVAWRAAVCQAIAGMLAQVGIRTAFQPWPTATFFPKLTQATTSFFEFGWSPGTDAWPTLNAIVRSNGADGAGTFNGGRYSNPRLDQLIDAIRVEPDLSRRRQLIGDALRAVRADLPLIPLYRRTLTWVMRPDISVAQWPNDVLELRYVQIGEGPMAGRDPK